MNEDRILTIQEVATRTSLSIPTIYRRIKAGDFPKQVSLGLNRVGWLDSKVVEWINARQQKAA